MASAARPLPAMTSIARPAFMFAATSVSVIPPPFATIVTEGRPADSRSNTSYIVCVSEPQPSWPAGTDGSSTATITE